MAQKRKRKNSMVRLRKSWRVRYVIAGVFVAAFLFGFLTVKFKDNDAVDAANLGNFDAGYIISDYQMSNYNSMSESEIQSFLKKKGNCNDTRTYLADYYTSYYYHIKDGHFVCLADETFGNGTAYGNDAPYGESAAHIIWQAARDYKINPQVLIVLLQKEQGLITDSWPNNRQYRSATGYGCPDTAPCNSEYYGFKNQVRKAAALFRTVLDGGWTNYPLGWNYIQYNPDADCGGSWVNVRSLGTSALYRYTPYQPNASALAAGYGSGDSCGAYGNRNFYLYFEDWFGGATYEDEWAKCDPFCDMPADEYSTTAIKWMYESGITNYYSRKGEFAPNEKVNGNQYSLFLSRYQQKYADGEENNVGEVMGSLGKTLAEGVSRGDAVYYLYLLNDAPVKTAKGLRDLPKDSMGRVAIDWAYNKGITKYYNKPGEFAPYANITRREVVLFLWRYSGAPSVYESNLSDLPSDPLVKNAINWAYEKGITKYYTKVGEFAPSVNITRREAAIFLYRFYLLQRDTR